MPGTWFSSVALIWVGICKMMDQRRERDGERKKSVKFVLWKLVPVATVTRCQGKIGKTYATGVDAKQFNMA